MSRERGIRLQNALAAYLRRWWPSAESTPSGRSGTDVLGTPSVAWECKTAREFSPAAFVRQAKDHTLCRCRTMCAPGCDGDSGDLPVVVYFPPGLGAQSCGKALAILPLDALMEVLVEAGHAPYPRPAGEVAP